MPWTLTLYIDLSTIFCRKYLILLDMHSMKIQTTCKLRQVKGRLGKFFQEKLGKVYVGHLCPFQCIIGAQYIEKKCTLCLLSQITVKYFFVSHMRIYNFEIIRAFRSMVCC